MRKYRLLKDTPTIKAGTIFQEVTSDYDKSRELVRIMPTSGTTSPQWTIDDIINFDEWFEEVKEFEGWKPEEGEWYRGLTDGGSLVTTINGNVPMDKHRISIGNAYPLDTPDELIIKEQKLIPQAMHRLKMAAKKAWFELYGSEGPDWGDDKQRKYLLSYDHRYKGLSIYWLASLQESILPPFPTRGSAQAYIDNNLDDLKLLFGVE